MYLEPRHPETGWKKRTFVNSVRLCLRSPGWWFVTYIGVPALTFYFPYPPVQAMVLCFSVIFGTFLCFSCDHLSTANFLDYLALLKRRPQPLIHTTAIAVVMGFGFEGADLSTPETPVDSYLSFGGLLFFVYFAHLLSAILILLTLDFPRLLFEGWKSDRSGKDIESNFQLFGIFSVFTLHLCVDTDLDWKSANDLSEKGVEILGTGRIILMMSIPITLIAPPLLGLFVAWAYCIYREIFWQQGITPKTKRLEADGLVAT